MNNDFFISGGLHERPIKTPKGEVKIWLKELPNTAYTRFQSHMASDDHEVRAAAMPLLVSMAVCDADGEQSMDVKKASLLKTPILTQMFKHVMALANAGDVGNDSPPAEKSGSGTPSPSPSAANQ